MPKMKPFECAYNCDEPEYGGTIAFRGNGVTEQTVAIDMCENHWERIYDETIRKQGWLPNDPRHVRLVRLYEENGYSADASYHETEIQKKVDTPDDS